MAHKRRLAAGAAIGAVLAVSAAAGLTSTGTPSSPKTQSVTMLGSSTTSTSAISGHCEIKNNLPDPRCTPGAINPDVTQTNIGSTICKPGWTSTVRPPTSYTTPLKHDVMGADAFTVAYKGVSYTDRGYGLTDTNTRDFELDHRVPLEIAGSPADPANLWPQQYERAGASASRGSETKDRLENFVNNEVCAGKMTLAQGQAVFLGDFWAWADAHISK